MEGKIDGVFEEAFKEIKKKFETYFKLIFGGGKAELDIVKIKRRKATEGVRSVSARPGTFAVASVQPRFWLRVARPGPSR